MNVKDVIRHLISTNNWENMLFISCRRAKYFCLLDSSFVLHYMCLFQFFFLFIVHILLLDQIKTNFHFQMNNVIMSILSLSRNAILLAWRNFFGSKLVENQVFKAKWLFNLWNWRNWNESFNWCQDLYLHLYIMPMVWGVWHNT